jgi:hypothetical protein
MNLADATIGQQMIPVTDPDGNQLGPMSEVVLAGA